MRKRGTGPLVILTLIIALGTIAQGYMFDASIARARDGALATDQAFGALNTSLAELRAAQAGYVATGQSPDYWMSRVGEVLGGVETSLGALTAASTNPEARPHYESADMMLGEVRRLDERARDNARKDQKFLASDLVFMDGLEASKRLAGGLDQARAAEAAGANATIARLTWMRFGMYALVLGFLGVVMLFYARAARTAAVAMAESESLSIAPAPEPVVPVAAAAAPAPPVVSPPPPAAALTVNLSEAAELCVDLARVMDTRDLPALLGRAARVLDAKGVVLWMADADGVTLRPSLAHGYADAFVARLGTLAADGDSVTSAAFRSLKPQTVHSPTAKGNGAIAVPLITASGCLGVLAAEIRQSKPSGERTAMARVIAAQFAALVAPAADVVVAETPARIAEA